MEKTRPNESTLMQKMKQLSKFFKSEYALSSLQQFYVLLNMMFIKILRNRLVLWIQFFHHLGCGFFIGLIFLNSANDGKRMFDRKFSIKPILFLLSISFSSRLKVLHGRDLLRRLHSDDGSYTFL